MKGKRTYITLSVLALHQLAKIYGIDIPDETLSALIDVLLSGIAAYFRNRATE